MIAVASAKKEPKTNISPSEPEEVSIEYIGLGGRGVNIYKHKGV